MKNLINLFLILLSLISWNQGIAQESFQQKFQNIEPHPVKIMRGTEVLLIIEGQGIDEVTVKEGDRITFKLPENVDLKETAIIGAEPRYMTKYRNKSIKIEFFKKFSEFEQRKGQKLLSMASNYKGVDLAKLNQMEVVNSFSKQPIFENLGTHSFAYAFKETEILPIGFSYDGFDNIAFGSNKVYSYSSARNFEKGFSVGVTGEAPIPGTPATVGLGVAYSEAKKEGGSEEDIYFSNYSGVKVYTVSLYEEDLVDVLLSDKFKEAVMSLNNRGEVRRKIIDRFGTHYPESVTYGGSFRSWKHISSRDYYDMVEKNINVSAEVKLATPTESKIMTSKILTKNGSGFEKAVESTEGGAQGNAGFNFNNVEKNEYKERLSNSKGDFRAIGGPGDNAAAIDVHLVEIHKLVYPHIFKNGSEKDALSTKREWIRLEVLDYLKEELPKLSSTVPTYKLYKVKLNRAKKVGKNLDDANQKMMGSIILKEPGNPMEYPLWKEDKFVMINETSGELKLDPNQEWTIIKVPVINGVPKDITINAEIKLTNLDDCCGNDLHAGSFPIRLKEIDGNKSFTKKVTHTAFFEETNWEVKFVIQEIPNFDIPGSGQSDRALRTLSNNTVKYPTRKASYTEKEFKGFTKATVVYNGPVREVKFHGQNYITMEQAKAIATQNGWQIASSSEIIAAFQKHKLDVYAFGMMADGRFAVPVQKDHSNFKKGPNIGASGGNQGFFYTMSENITATKATSSTTAAPPTTTTTTTSNKSKDGLFDFNGTYYITDAKHKRALRSSPGGGVYHHNLPPNSPGSVFNWYFMPTGDGYYYIYDLQYNKALIGPDYFDHLGSGSAGVYHQDANGKATAQWKITPSGTAGQYIITDRKHNMSLVAGDVANDNIYLQSHNNRQNAYWIFTLTDAKAPASKPDPNATPTQTTTTTTTATTATTPTTTTTSTPTTGVQKGKESPFKETPWLDNDFVRIQNKSNNTHYIHNQWGELESSPIQADWLSAQWKFVAYAGTKNVGNFQNRSNPELYLINNEGNVEVEVVKNPSNLQWDILLWRIIPDQDNDGWFRIGNLGTVNESLQIENGQLKVGVLKNNLSDAMWKVEFGPITGSGVVAAPPKTKAAPPKPTNVALNKPTKQSSVFAGNVSKYAVDGEIQGESRPAHTLRDNNPWWEVDLGANYNISQINVFNITDNNLKYRTHNLYIRVSKTPFTKNDGQGFADNVFPNTVGYYKGNATGRYVRIFLVANEYLNISEVQVMGVPATEEPVAETPASNTMNPASPGSVRIQNSWKKTHYIHNQNGKIEDGQIQANDVSNWWSAQWQIVPVHSGWVRIQNKWKPDQYLHNQNGKLEVGKIDNNWASAMWKLVPTHSGWVRIQNSWYKDQYIHNQNGKLEVGKIDNNWASALWKVE